MKSVWDDIRAESSKYLPGLVKPTRTLKTLGKPWYFKIKRSEANEKTPFHHPPDLCSWWYIVYTVSHRESEIAIKKSKIIHPDQDIQKNTCLQYNKKILPSSHCRKNNPQEPELLRKQKNNQGQPTRNKETRQNAVDQAGCGEVLYRCLKACIYVLDGFYMGFT